MRLTSYNNGSLACARGISGNDDDQGLRDHFRMPMCDIESSYFRLGSEGSEAVSFWRRTSIFIVLDCLRSLTLFARTEKMIASFRYSLLIRVLFFLNVYMIPSRGVGC